MRSDSFVLENISSSVIVGFILRLHVHDTVVILRHSSVCLFRQRLGEGKLQNQTNKTPTAELSSAGGRGQRLSGRRQGGQPDATNIGEAACLTCLEPRWKRRGPSVCAWPSRSHDHPKQYTQRLAFCRFPPPLFIFFIITITKS